MDATTIIPVIVPIFSGLTFLAYKHPEGYSRLFKTISKWAVPIVAFRIGYLIGGQDVARIFEAGQVADVVSRAKTIGGDLNSSVEFLFLYIGGAWSYLAILTYLPEITRPRGSEVIQDDKSRAAEKTPNQTPEPTIKAGTPAAEQQSRQH